jgi:heterodisulfide reductase subunit C/large-conductance mechanosensitive channel
MISSVIFVLCLAAGIFFFTRKVRKIIRNIRVGRPIPPATQKKERWLQMIRVAFGQSRMIDRPVAGIMHFFIYAGFIIINIEILEILIDGIFGTHRVFSFFGPLYNVLIGSFEVLALLVILACVIFLIRRNILRLARFHQREMTQWPKSDANIILITEILLMSFFLTMNAADWLLQRQGVHPYIQAGSFPVSSILASWLNEMTVPHLIFLERFCWWAHILGVLAFLNYIPYSKHFHIFISFPNTWYASLNPAGELNNMDQVTREVKLMLGETEPATDPAEQVRFGARDVFDLSHKQLMDAFACTECGRCSSVCPANQTGRLLSPRKIMMDTRDRLEEVGRNIDLHGQFKEDGKSLLYDYITPEELWACTTCNACVEACPVLINPLSIIIDLRRYLVMEESAAPAPLNSMFTRLENNGAPWQFSPSDRMKWSEQT